MAAKNNQSPVIPSDQNYPNVKPKTPFQIMLRAMANDATADDGTISGDDINEILAAETLAEMWEADVRPPINFQHLAGCDLAVIDFAVKFSRGGDDMLTPFTWTNERGEVKKMYIIAECMRLSEASDKPLLRLPPVGQTFSANTSARFIVAKLWRAMTLGELDYSAGKILECRVEEIELSGTTAVLKLRPLNASRPVQSEAVL
jgi:hypothetical protein